ncbi:MAG: hypothetical protein AAFX99_04805 [Myxococcota bacterium]
MSVVWAMAAGGCGDESSGDESGEGVVDSSELWECVDERDGWEQCDGTSVIWCHAVAHGNYDSGHFHEGSNCAEDSATCVELDEQTAACADPAAPCEAGFAECSDRDALNCVEGSIATMRCSLTEMCAVTDEGARCVSQ